MFFIIGCKNKVDSITKVKVIIDPNPTSEMAQQMRDMNLDLEKIKSRLENNELLRKDLLNFKLIHKQKVTDISFNKIHIEPMSKSFAYSVEKFNREPDIKNYSMIINNCISCHNLSCQGPLVKINKLRITP